MAGAMNTGVFPVFGEYGDREPDMLARWFNDMSSTPLVLVKGDTLVGFAVISKPLPNLRNPVDYRLAEFYVVPTERRRGVGREAVELIFKRFAGRWEIVENSTNQSAISFWRSVVRKFSGGQYRERAESGEIKQYFDSTSMRAPTR